MIDNTSSCHGFSGACSSKKHHYVADRLRRVWLRRTGLKFALVGLIVARIYVGIHVALRSKLSARFDRVSSYFSVRAELVAVSVIAAFDKWTVDVNEVFDAQTDINEFFNFRDAEPIHIAADTVTVIRHFVNHFAIGLAEPLVALKKIAMAINVSDNHLMIGHAVTGEQIGVAWIVVDD